MSPASLYSYFDAQLLADFIMSRQYPGYDGTNSTAAAATTTYTGPSDYDSYDDARSRKRRMTLSNDRILEGLPDIDSSLFTMLDQGSSFYSGPQATESLSSLPIPPQQQQHHHQNGQACLALGGFAFSQPQYCTAPSGEINDVYVSGGQQQQIQQLQQAQQQRVGGEDRRASTLRITVSEEQSTESANQPPQTSTPSLFTPSFIDAVEYAGMTSPQVFPPAASPGVYGYTGVSMPTIDPSVFVGRSDQLAGLQISMNAAVAAAMGPADSAAGQGRRSRKRAATAGSADQVGAYVGSAGNRQAEVRGQGAKVMMILTSKVAQKSYGTEKRFLCPPPTVIVFGDDWQAADAQDAGLPRVSVSVPTTDGGDEPRTAQFDWLGAPRPLDKPTQYALPPSGASPMPEGGSGTGRFVAKQLYINDVDEKRKKVAVSVRLHDATGRVALGAFESRPIKVISKPSKKRQSVKNVELCIHHGSTVSLFNRLRSQTVSTKYLGVSHSIAAGGPRPFWFPGGPSATPAAKPGAATVFVARTAVWDPFIIWIVNTQLTQPEVDAFNARLAENPTPVPGYPTPPAFALYPQCPPDFDGGRGASEFDGDATGQPHPRAPIPIMYNQPVVLQCLSTGMCSPVLVLRKVEKGSVAVGSYYGRDPSRDVVGDPVSQLHKVAFEVRKQVPDEAAVVEPSPAMLHHDAGSYLACLGDTVGANASSDGRQLTAASSPFAARRQPKDAPAAGSTSWAEDVGDSAVWTMVGTDCAIYRFDYPPPMPLPLSPVARPLPLSPPAVSAHDLGAGLPQLSLDMLLGSAVFSQQTPPDAFAAAMYGMGMPTHFLTHSPPVITPESTAASRAHDSDSDDKPAAALDIRCLLPPDDRAVPVVFKATVATPFDDALPSSSGAGVAGRACIALHGINFSQDMTVLFDGQPSVFTEFKSPEHIVCLAPLAADFDKPPSAPPTDDEGFEDDRNHGLPLSPQSDAIFSSSSAASSRKRAHHRSSSDGSTASSATATQCKRDSVRKLPIYLVRTPQRGGPSSMYKTGQFYLMHA